MSSGVLDLGTRVPQQKRVYSKGGCRECKRRKIKCDEGKPYCWQCLRLRKECSYPEVGEKVLRVSKKKQQEQEGDHPHGQTQPQQMKPEYEGSQLDHRTRIHEQSLEQGQEQLPRPMYQSPASAIMSPNNSNSPNVTPVQRTSSPHQLGVPFGQHYVGQQFPHIIAPHQQQQQLNHPPVIGYPLPAPSLQQLQHLQVPPRVVGQIPSPGVPLPNTGFPVPQSQPIVSHPVINQPNHSPIATTETTHTPPSGGGYTGFLPSSLKKQSVLLPPPQSSSQSAPQSPYKESEPPTKKLKSDDKQYSGASILSLLNDTKVSPNSDSSVSGKSNGHLTDNITSTPSDEAAMLELFSEQDLNVLAMDLNNMVSGLMYDMNYENNQSNTETDYEDVSTTSMEPSPILSNPSQIVRNLPLTCIRVKRKKDLIYLEEFYNEFANIILPFSSYDEKTQCYFNPARDMILRNAADTNYLLAAVLAIGARCLFLRTKIQKHEEVYCVYLSRCLQLLGPALSADDRQLTTNIESVLLTVLLLATTNASNPKQDWRPHLKGGKDLLLKNSIKKIKSSNVLIFCKSWFVTLEILAGISSKHGGTLQTDEEIDLLINSGDEHEQFVLREIGIIVENGFNIMGGYHNDCYDHFRDLLKILNRIRNNPGYNPQDSFEYMRLFSKFQMQTEIEFINKKGLLTPEDFPGLVPNRSLIDSVTINSKEFVISWMDVSHQSYTMASLITLLCKCFQEPYTAPQIQLLTKSIVKFVSYLDNISDIDRDGIPNHQMKSALMMLQWPMFVASNNLIDDDLKSIASKFFQVSSQIGSGGATIALKRVSKIWLKRENGLSTEEDETELEDLVAY